jgi:uncharacterized membrane protein YhaH (DUF805 family)
MFRMALLVIWISSMSLMLSFVLKEKVYLDRRHCSLVEHGCGMALLLIFSPLIFISDLILYIRKQHDPHRRGSGILTQLRDSAEHAVRGRRTIPDRERGEQSVLPAASDER